MRVKILLCSFILCLLTVAGYDQELPFRTLANEYLKLGLFYKGLFNSALNRQINNCNARLYLIDNKEKADKFTGRKGKFTEEEISYSRYYRGLCYYYQGSFEKAIADFKMVPKSSDKYIEAQLKLGACYYQQGKIKKGKELWNKIYSQNKDELLFLSRLGNLYAELGINIDTAGLYCKRTKKREIGLGWIYLKKEEIDAALKLIEKLSIQKSDLNLYDPGILRLKSQLYLILAVKYYQKAIREEEDDYLRCQLGIAQLMSGRLNDSITTLKPLLNSKRWQIKAKAMINLGIAYYLKGSETQADRLWDEVRNEYNRRPGVMSELGYTYSRLGIRLNEALSLCREEAGAPSYHRGMVYFKKGLLENNIDYIFEAPGLLERGCGQPTGYEPEIDNPLWLLDLSNAYYYKRFFEHSIQPISWLLDYYPDVEGVYYATQVMNNTWRVLQWFPRFKIEWVDTWYQMGITQKEED